MLVRLLLVDILNTLSFSDHYEFWRATESGPGINYLVPEDLDEEERAEKMVELKEYFMKYRQNVRWQLKVFLLILGGFDISVLSLGPKL